MDDRRSTAADALVATARRAVTPGTEDEDAFWEALQSLVKATTVDEALLTARELCASPDLPSRIAGAGLVAERCNPYAPELAGFVSTIEDVAATETDPSVLSLALQALGHAGVEAGLPTILRLRSHADADVRLAVARALDACAGDPPHREALDALIELSSDSDDDVRDWSTFGLGCIAFDDDAVRNALAARLNDPHLDTQCEAIVGLARRDDARAFEPTLALLEAESVPRLAVEAAALLGDDRLLGALQTLEPWWDVDVELLALARDRCTPALREARHAQELRIAEQIKQGFAEAIPHGRIGSVRIEHEYLGIPNDLTVTWIKPDGETDSRTWGLDHILERDDVRNDPGRAATMMLRQLAEADELAE